MTERYIDPNSGAAPQPGGQATHAPVLADAEPEVRTPQEAEVLRQQDVEEKQEATDPAPAETPEIEEPTNEAPKNEDETNEDDDK